MVNPPITIRSLARAGKHITCPKARDVVSQLAVHLRQDVSSDMRIKMVVGDRVRIDDAPLDSQGRVVKDGEAMIGREGNVISVDPLGNPSPILVAVDGLNSWFFHPHMLTLLQLKRKSPLVLGPGVWGKIRCNPDLYEVSWMPCVGQRDGSVLYYEVGAGWQNSLRRNDPQKHESALPLDPAEIVVHDPGVDKRPVLLWCVRWVLGSHTEQQASVRNMQYERSGLLSFYRNGRWDMARAYGFPGGIGTPYFDASAALEAPTG